MFTVTLPYNRVDPLSIAWDMVYRNESFLFIRLGHMRPYFLDASAVQEGLLFDGYSDDFPSRQRTPDSSSDDQYDRGIHPYD